MIYFFMLSILIYILQRLILTWFEPDWTAMNRLVDIVFGSYFLLIWFTFSCRAFWHTYCSSLIFTWFEPDWTAMNRLVEIVFGSYFLLIWFTFSCRAFWYTYCQQFDIYFVWTGLNRNEPPVWPTGSTRFLVCKSCLKYISI